MVARINAVIADFAIFDETGFFTLRQPRVIAIDLVLGDCVAER